MRPYGPQFQFGQDQEEAGGGGGGGVGWGGGPLKVTVCPELYCLKSFVFHLSFLKRLYAKPFTAVWSIKT